MVWIVIAVVGAVFLWLLVRSVSINSADARAVAFVARVPSAEAAYEEAEEALGMARRAYRGEAMPKGEAMAGVVLFAALYDHADMLEGRPHGFVNRTNYRKSLYAALRADFEENAGAS